MMYDEKVEEAVLGAILIEENCFYRIADSLSEDCFFDESNKFIYKAIVKVSSVSKIDILTVSHKCAELKKGLKDERMKEINWPYKVSTLTNVVASAAHVVEHIDILKIYRAKRIVYETCYNATKLLDEGEPVKDIIDDITDKITEASNQKSRTEVSIQQGLRDFIDNQQKSLDQKLLPTYIPEVDKVIGGFEYSDLIIVAGAASMGKTSFMLKLLQNFLKFQKNVAIFSLEMSNNQLLTRLLSMETGIKVRNIRYNDLDTSDWDKLHVAIGKLERTTFTMDGQTTSLTDVLNKIKKLKIQNDIDVVFIDYLQLITANGGRISREQEVAKIARSLKNIAKELNIVVVALSQLSRALMQRDNKRPVLSDLRESGEIEQAADTIMFAFREEYYTMENPREIQDAEIIIAKGRNVGIGTAYLKFMPNNVLFISPEETGMTDLNSCEQPAF